MKKKLPESKILKQAKMLAYIAAAILFIGGICMIAFNIAFTGWGYSRRGGFQQNTVTGSGLIFFAVFIFGMTYYFSREQKKE